MMMRVAQPPSEEIERLHDENARLVALLEANGRLHREHATKTDVRIIDFVDTGHPALLRMWDKRQRGYRAMGYRIKEYPIIR